MNDTQSFHSLHHFLIFILYFFSLYHFFSFFFSNITSSLLLQLFSITYILSFHYNIHHSFSLSFHDFSLHLYFSFKTNYHFLFLFHHSLIVYIGSHLNVQLYGFKMSTLCDLLLCLTKELTKKMFSCNNFF